MIDPFLSDADESFCTLRVDVWDKAAKSQSDFMGRIEIDLKRILERYDVDDKPMEGKYILQPREGRDEKVSGYLSLSLHFKRLVPLPQPTRHPALDGNLE